MSSKADFYFGFSHDLTRFGSHCGIAPDGTRLPGYFDGPISIRNDEPSALVEEKVAYGGEVEEGVVEGLIT